MYAFNSAVPDTVPGSVCHLHMHSWREPMQQQVDLVNIGVSPLLSVSMLALMQVAGRHQLHTPSNINCKAESTWLGCQHNPLNADHHQSDAIPFPLLVNIGGRKWHIGILAPVTMIGNEVKDHLVCDQETQAAAAACQQHI